MIQTSTFSTKTSSTLFYSNERYEHVGGIPSEEMKKLEKQFLLLCDFKLSIPIDELQSYTELLYAFWNINNKAKVYNIDLDNSKESNIQYLSLSRINKYINIYAWNNIHIHTKKIITSFSLRIAYINEQERNFVSFK